MSSILGEVHREMDPTDANLVSMQIIAVSVKTKSKKVLPKAPKELNDIRFRLVWNWPSKGFTNIQEVFDFIWKHVSGQNCLCKSITFTFTYPKKYPGLVTLRVILEDFRPK